MVSLNHINIHRLSYIFGCVLFSASGNVGVIDVNATTSVCGDGILEGSEACDDGNVTDGDGCRADCSIEICGDGILDLGEACDDGNTTSGDGCSADCLYQATG